MKAILIAVALLAGTFTKSFANDGGTVAPVVLKSFKSTFASATDVDWSYSKELYKAVFFLDERAVTAYYNTDGTLAVLTRHITTATLPVILQTALKNNHKDKWIADVYEVTNEAGVEYYVTLEDADCKLVLKSNGSFWNTFQKSRKN
jgi:hypothetical protein